MACRSCGIGPVKLAPTRVKNIPNPSQVKIKGTVRPTTKKISVPTRSPARTFNTLGD